MNGWVSFRTFTICTALISLCITHFLAPCFVYFLNVPKKVYREENNLFFIVKHYGGSSFVCKESLGSPYVFVDPRCICIWNVSTLFYGAPRDLPFPRFNPFSCNVRRAIKTPHVAWQWNSYLMYPSNHSKVCEETQTRFNRRYLFGPRAGIIMLDYCSWKLGSWLARWLRALEACWWTKTLVSLRNFIHGHVEGKQENGLVLQ